jgi:MFS family permease
MSLPGRVPSCPNWGLAVQGTTTRRILICRALRAFSDGYVSVLLPAYLLTLGFGEFEIGAIGTITLTGSALATLALGAIGHRWSDRYLLLGASVLMAGTGLGFANFGTFWPLALVAFFGTLNPSSGDVSVFLPLEHARLAAAAEGEARTVLFARYTLTGSICAAVGALASGIPALIEARIGMQPLDSMRVMFGLYAGIGVVTWFLYRGLQDSAISSAAKPAPLGPSRSTVFKLAALFSVDAFAGGFVINSLLALWLFKRFGLSLGMVGTLFFWMGLLTTASQWVAPLVARRIGLLNTMVFTHVPANICLVLAAFAPSAGAVVALLFVRSALSQMDVPTRTAYVMAVVTPPERVAAASFTAVPRSLASAASPSLGGALLSAGMLNAPLLICGSLKIAYDLALLFSFRRRKSDSN